MTTTGRRSRKPSLFRRSTTIRRAPPSPSPCGASRSFCSTNPMSSSPGRAPRWRRRAASRRSENGRRQDENQRLDQPEGGETVLLAVVWGSLWLRKWELVAVFLLTVAVYAAGLVLPICTQRAVDMIANGTAGRQL